MVVGAGVLAEVDGAGAGVDAGVGDDIADGFGNGADLRVFTRGQTNVRICFHPAALLFFASGRSRVSLNQRRPLKIVRPREEHRNRNRRRSGV